MITGMPAATTSLKASSSASGTQSGPTMALGCWLSAVRISLAASGPRLS